MPQALFRRWEIMTQICSNCGLRLKHPHACSRDLKEFECPLCNKVVTDLSSQIELDIQRRVYVMCSACWIRIIAAIEQENKVDLEKSIRGFLMVFLGFVNLNFANDYNLKRISEAKILAKKILEIKTYINDKFDFDPTKPKNVEWLTAPEKNALDLRTFNKFWKFILYPYFIL